MSDKKDVVENQKATAILNDVMDELVPGDVDFKRDFGINMPPAYQYTTTYRKLMIRRLVHKACTGDGKATQEVLDRLLGKSVQKNTNINMEASYTEFLDSIQDIEDAIPTSSLIGKIQDEDSEEVYEEPMRVHPEALSANVESML